MKMYNKDESTHKRLNMASDPNERNSVSKTEANIPQKRVYPPGEGFLLLYKELYMATCNTFCDSHISDKTLICSDHNLIRCLLCTIESKQMRWVVKCPL